MCWEQERSSSLIVLVLVPNVPNTVAKCYDDDS